MARVIDVDKLLDDITAAEEHGGMGAVIAGMLKRYVMRQPILTPPNEWVSVDNKLPKNGVPVLIGNPHWDYPVVASCAGYGVWMDSWHQKMTFTPTYWMPLPAPPDRRPPEGDR